MSERDQNETSILPEFRLTRSMKSSVRVDVCAGPHPNSVVSTPTARPSMSGGPAAADVRHP